MIKRDIERKIRDKIGKGKAIIIYGPRQVGKTTLLHTIFDDFQDVLWLNGDEQSTHERLEYTSAESYKVWAAAYKYIIIDEAQRIENIGLKLKILQDNFGDRVQIVATGSSSFELANKINEPLTGRKWTFFLPPFSESELAAAHGYVAEQNNLRNRLLYGMYPAVVNELTDAEETLHEFTDESLYKDVLKLGEIIKTDKLQTILKALAYQIGSQVSLNELAQLVGLDRKTVDKYIALLEQAFVIFRLPSYGRNLRNELKASQKIYFYDVGIRNALIGAFQPVDFRNDIGALFENFVVAELKKKNQYGNFYFWRNTDQQEVDFLSENGEELTAVEIKWNEKKAGKMPRVFVEAYHPVKEEFITRENYLEKLVGD